MIRTSEQAMQLLACLVIGVLVDDEDFERLSQHKWFAMLHHGNWFLALGKGDRLHSRPPLSLQGDYT
jgi:hypothetical protein